MDLLIKFTIACPKPPGDAWQLLRAKELQELVNQYAASSGRPGLPVDEIQLASRNGVRKINVEPTSRLPLPAPFASSVGDAGEIRSRDYMKPARAAMQKVVAQRMTSSPGRSRRRLQAISIADMAKGYKDGSLVTKRWWRINFSRLVRMKQRASLASGLSALCEKCGYRVASVVHEGDCNSGCSLLPEVCSIRSVCAPWRPGLSSCT